MIYLKYEKILRTLLAILLLLIIALIIIFVFNPFNSRTKIISNILNSYLTNTFENYSPLDNLENKLNNIESNLPTMDHPLLSDEQEAMESCFSETLGTERINEIIAGASPSALEFFKAKNCLEK
ncbi:MAG: hypothetical protein Q8P83_00290 [bacterium]|nr:hypothetical protein [bacterium]